MCVTVLCIKVSECLKKFARESKCETDCKEDHTGLCVFVYLCSVVGEKVKDGERKRWKK